MARDIFLTLSNPILGPRGRTALGKAVDLGDGSITSCNIHISGSQLNIGTSEMPLHILRFGLRSIKFGCGISKTMNKRQKSDHPLESKASRLPC